MSKPCGCGFFVACDYHSRQWDEMGSVLSSLQIAQGMAKRANDRIEGAVSKAEDTIALWENVAATVVFAALLALIYIVCS